MHVISMAELVANAIGPLFRCCYLPNTDQMRARLRELDAALDLEKDRIARELERLGEPK